MSLTSLVTTAATTGTEAHNELPIHPYLVGALVLAILLALLAGLLMFGKGREHS